MPHNIILIYFRLPYFHFSNSALLPIISTLSIGANISFTNWATCPGPSHISCLTHTKHAAPSLHDSMSYITQCLTLYVHWHTESLLHISDMQQLTSYPLLEVQGDHLVEPVCHWQCDYWPWRCLLKAFTYITESYNTCNLPPIFVTDITKLMK